MIPLFIGVGIAFGSLAGVMAFLITFNEWQKHKVTGWRLWGEALRAGWFAFVFFLILSVLLGYILIYLKY